MEILIIRILTATVSILLLIIAFFYYLYRKRSFWLRALVLRSFYNPIRLLFMQMRKTDARLFMELKVRCIEGSLDISDKELESVVRSMSPENAGRIVETAIRAKSENIAADIGFFRSQISSGIDIRQLLAHKILADRIGIDAELKELADHELAGGNTGKVMEALSIAAKTDEPIDFQCAATVDLAGRDIVEAARNIINPRMIRTEKISAVAKNGFQVSARALITIRTDPEQLIGGAGAETILTRAGEALLAALTNAESPQKILEAPNSISDAVWTDNLDENTAYTVMSVEISEIEVGENIGARQRIQRAREEKDIALAEVERQEQELRVRVLETRAKYLEADAKIPSALTAAFEKGKLGFADYYRMRKFKPDKNFRDFRLSGDSDDEAENEPENNSAEDLKN